MELYSGHIITDSRRRKKSDKNIGSEIFKGHLTWVRGEILILNYEINSHDVRQNQTQKIRCLKNFVLKVTMHNIFFINKTESFLRKYQHLKQSCLI